MFKLLSLLTIIPLTASAMEVAAGEGCKDWCGGYCLDACQSTLAAPVCLDQLHCHCICPTVKSECSTQWCDGFCQGKANGRGYEATCGPNDNVCHCKYDKQPISQLARKFTRPRAPAQVEVQPASETREEATARLTLESATHAHHQSLQTVKKFECTQSWCDSYCISKSNGRKFDAWCNAGNACQCQYAWQPTSRAHPPAMQPTAEQLGEGTASSGVVSGSVGSTVMRKFECTHKWCDDFCGPKADGRKYTATCNEEQQCRCFFAARPINGTFVH